MSYVFAVHPDDVDRFLADEPDKPYQQVAQAAIREKLAAHAAGKKITECAYGHEPFAVDCPPVSFVIAVVVGADTDTVGISTANFCGHCADQMTREHLTDLAMHMTESLTDDLWQRRPPAGRLH